MVAQYAETIENITFLLNLDEIPRNVVPAGQPWTGGSQIVFHLVRKSDIRGIPFKKGKPAASKPSFRKGDSL